MLIATAPDTIIKTCPCCGREFTADAWSNLPLVGETDDGVDAIQMRNCVCGSTIAIVIGVDAVRIQQERADEIADDFREDPRDFDDRCDHFSERAIDRYDSRDDGFAS